MAIFNGTDLAEVVAQINKDNPLLPWPINETDFLFGKPEVIASPTDGRNTRIKITPKASSKYRGALTLTYTRRDLSNLFRGQKVQFTRWLNDGASMTLAQAVGYINQLYGINLPAAKMSGTAWNYSNSGGTRTWTATADNLAYVGSFNVTWNRGLQQLGLDILTISELDGAQWPGGNDFVTDPDRRFRGEFLLAGIDVTEYALAGAWNSNIPAQTLNNAVFDTLFQFINARTGLNFNRNTYDKDTNPLGGMGSYQLAATVALPTAQSTSPLREHYNKPGFAYAVAFDLRTHPLVKSLVPLYYNL